MVDVVDTFEGIVETLDMIPFVMELLRLSREKSLQHFDLFKQVV